MKHRILAILLALFASSPAAATMIISEYIEGSETLWIWGNDAIELTNVGASTIDLTGWTIEIYRNGSTTPNSTIALDTVSVDSGDAFLLAGSFADAALASIADQTSLGVQFSGNDAIVLVDNGTVIDHIGTVGDDPAAGFWGTDPNTTQNHSLRRNTLTPNPNIFDPFDPSTEWVSAPIDDFTDAGIPVPMPEPATSLLLMLGLASLAARRQA